MNQPARKYAPAPGRPIRIGHQRVEPTPPLQVVAPPSPGARRRRTARHTVVGLAVVFAALFGLAAFHTLLVQRQFQLDDLNTAVAEETGRNQRLRLRVAEMESPDRIVQEATDRLGMVPPPAVMYLSPSEEIAGLADRVEE